MYSSPSSLFARERDVVTAVTVEVADEMSRYVTVEVVRRAATGPGRAGESDAGAQAHGPVARAVDLRVHGDVGAPVAVEVADGRVLRFRCGAGPCLAREGRTTAEADLPVRSPVAARQVRGAVAIEVAHDDLSLDLLRLGAVCRRRLERDGWAAPVAAPCSAERVLVRVSSRPCEGRSWQTSADPVAIGDRTHQAAPVDGVRRVADSVVTDQRVGAADVGSGPDRRQALRQGDAAAGDETELDVGTALVDEVHRVVGREHRCVGIARVQDRARVVLAQSGRVRLGVCDREVVAAAVFDTRQRPTHDDRLALRLERRVGCAPE